MPLPLPSHRQVYITQVLKFNQVSNCQSTRVGAYGRDLGWTGPGLPTHLPHLPHLPHLCHLCIPRVLKHCCGGSSAGVHSWPTQNQLCSCRLPSREPLMLVQLGPEDYAKAGDGGRAKHNLARDCKKKRIATNSVDFPRTLHCQ